MERPPILPDVFTTTLRTCDMVQTPEGVGQVMLMHKHKATVRFLETGQKRAFPYSSLTKVA